MLFGLTTVVSAALLFVVQPMLARYILPWFGGQPAVWTTALVFFQGALLGGYAYAHALSRIPRLRTQGGVHLLVLVTAFATLPITPTEAWTPAGSEEPTWHILALLTSSVGLPILVLASTSPLLQAWHARLRPSDGPYQLYAWSNAASLVALWSYPLIVEPLSSRQEQTTGWSWAFALFLCLVVACIWTVYRHERQPETAPTVPHHDEPHPSVGDRALWVGLPLVASLLLSAITNAASVDVAPVPFLWVMVLSLYLFTFVLSFSRPTGARRLLGGALSIPAFLLLYWVLYWSAETAIVTQILGYVIGFFVLCFALHEELGRLRPTPTFLTGFYFAIALGGVLGGAFVALVAPRVFVTVAELPLGLMATAAVLLLARLRDSRSSLAGGRPLWAWGMLLLAFTGYSVAIALPAARPEQHVISMQRGFFGILRVIRENGGRPFPYLTLQHGRIDHGIQYTPAAARQEPTAYYAPSSGLGLVLRHLPVPSGTRRLGMIGLGIGTATTYCAAGDRFRIYEIDPTLRAFVDQFFTYLRDARCEVSLILGDARLSLAREPSQQFDVLIVDAFAGDAIPIHLLTKEAIALYLHHLKPDGTLLIHASNRFFDLPPIIRATGRSLDLHVEQITNASEWGADWMLLTRDRHLLDLPEPHRATMHLVPDREAKAAWTDERVNLLDAFIGWPTSWWVSTGTDDRTDR